MNCQEIQTRLSEYFDKSLDAISMKGIEVHLGSCSRCRVEADSLHGCIHQVSGLPPVDPPLGFTQRVMAQIREINETPTLWDRLFFPLRVKIPLQATAVVLIGALAVVLSQKEDQINRRESSAQRTATIAAPIPSEKNNEISKDPALVAERPLRAEKPAKSTIKPTTDFAKQATQPARVKKAAAASAAIEQTQPEAPSIASAEAESRLEDKKETRRRPPIPTQEVSTSGEARSSRSDTFGFGAAAGALRQPSLRPGAFLAERSLSPLSEPRADVEFVVRRRSREHPDQKEAVSSDPDQPALAKQAAPASPPSSIVEIRWFTVPVNSFAQFKTELAAEASIESERALRVTENDFSQKSGRELLIKINILSSER
jgi:hypothetical protein